MVNTLYRGRMIYHTTYNTFVVSCHACPETLEVTTTQRGEARQRAWAHGWRQRGGAWVCPDCGGRV
jgi:hypothetical protein